MNATERIRALLDERGVWWDYGIGGPATTRFNANGVDLTFTPMRDGLVCSTILTPEQAIAATLGATDAKPTQAESSGTCHNTQFAEMDEKADKKHRMAVASVLYGGFFPEDEPAEFTCSACGETASIDWVTLYDIRFCPFCGRRVKKEDA